MTNELEHDIRARQRAIIEGGDVARRLAVLGDLHANIDMLRRKVARLEADRDEPFERDDRDEGICGWLLAVEEGRA